MGSNWPLKSLKELGVSLIDCVHKTPIAVENGIPYIGIPQMKNGIIDFSANPRLISEEDYQLWTVKAKPIHGDIVLSRRCNPGETAYVPKGSKFALGQNLVLLRPDPKKIHPGYLRWVVNSPIWWDEVSKYKNPGAVFDSLKCVDIPNFEVPEPTYQAQILIDKCLLDISDKIELNHQINQTLEQMAQALFKSWFVDFDPVVDNALDAGFFEQGLELPDELLRRAETRKAVRKNGDFKPLPGAIRQLFPVAFEECAEPSLGLGGWVPQAWTAAPLTKIANIVYGKNLPKTQITNNGYPVYGGNGVIGAYNKYLYKEPQVLISCRGAASGKVHWTKPFCFVTNNSLVIEEKSISSLYIYYCLLQQDLTNLTSGSAQPQMTIANLNPVNVLLPKNELISTFVRHAQDLQTNCEAKKVECEVLSNLRDTLLPKLISGELCLNEIETELAEENLN
ncbi:restriction endonuclease subunit S [Aeromonas sp. R4-1]|uniref:restriction endonuclease subunit S n=1 Tax=Aeromonas sp. R4-1 TaxID=3138464 RepID=UPI0034A4A761